MATAMKINKEKYLAKCKQALAKYEKPLAEYEVAVAKFEADTEAWGKKVIESKQLKMVVGRFNGEQTFIATGKMAEARPKQPSLEEFYSKYNLKGYLAYGAIEELKQVISLIEMTDSDTVGISVANKVSQYL